MLGNLTTTVGGVWGNLPNVTNGEDLVGENCILLTSCLGHQPCKWHVYGIMF